MADVTTIKCKRDDCRFERLPNTVEEDSAPQAQVLDKKGQAVAGTERQETVHFHYYCQTCGYEFTQSDKAGTRSPWVKTKRPAPAPEPAAT